MQTQKQETWITRSRRELKPHGTPEFPCAGYSAHLIAHAGEDVKWHWHEELEAVFLQSGALRLFIPGQVFTLQEGDGALVSTNVLHMAQAIDHCQLQTIVFNKDLLTGGDQTIYAKKYVQPFLECPALRCVVLRPTEDPDILSALRDAYFSLERGGAGHEWTVRNHLSRMWAALYQANAAQLGQAREGEDAGAVRADVTRMRAMLDYIHHHYQDNITLADISQVANIGQRECLRCFQRTIAISPRQYLLKYRVSEAAYLLRTTQLPISDISLRCGFDSPSNFAQAFRRFYAVTPREYRQNT